MVRLHILGVTVAWRLEDEVRFLVIDRKLFRTKQKEVCLVSIALQEVEMEMPKTKYEVGDQVYLARSNAYSEVLGVVLKGPLTITRLNVEDRKGGNLFVIYWGEDWMAESEENLFPTLEKAIQRLRVLAKEQKEEKREKEKVPEPNEEKVV